MVGVTQQVRGTTQKILFDIDNLGTQKAGILSQLRGSVGRDLSQTVKVWGLVYERMPEDLIGKSKQLTSAEYAIINTLQLYAVHQQGESLNVHQKTGGRGTNFGGSFGVLRGSDSYKNSDDVFTRLLLARTYDDLVYQLRHAIKIMKSKSRQGIEYDNLARDLFLVKAGYGEKVRLEWAKSYYTYKKMGDTQNDD